MNTIKLGNGINLQFIQTVKFKTTIICVLIRRPLTRGEATMNALLPGVLKSGCRKYPTFREINTALETMYGATFDIQVVKKGEEQILQFYIEVLEDVKEENLLRQALDFLEELIVRPLANANGFLKEAVFREKENLKAHIQGRINNKGEYLKLRCLEWMCRNEPFGVYGDGYLEDIDGIEPKALYDHYQHILQTSPIEIAAIGHFHLDSLVAMVQSKIPIRDKEKIIAIPFASSNMHIQKPTRKSEEARLSQGKICIGIKTASPAKGKAFFGLLLFNEILGGGANSKLFLNVREKESLCYHISSFIYRFKSIMMIQCGVEKHDMERAVELIEQEICHIREGNISDLELQNAKDGLIKSFAGIEDHPQATIDFYITQYLLADIDGIQEFIGHIHAVTRADIAKAAINAYTDTIYFMY